MIQFPERQCKPSPDTVGDGELANDRPGRFSGDPGDGLIVG